MPGHLEIINFVIINYNLVFYPHCLGDDRDFETLRERVLRTHLEASHVNTNRSGLKNVSRNIN